MEGPGDGGGVVSLPEDVPEEAPEGAGIPGAGVEVLPAGVLFDPE